MSVLKIDASARNESSNSRVLSQYIVDRLAQKTVVRDLVSDPLPAMTAEDLVGVHGSLAEDRQTLRDHLAISDQLIDELKAADTLVFGVPMYNFGIPASLKQWVDYICRAGVTFKYGEQGPIGLTGVKRAFIVTASGGTPIGSEADFASRYMEQICRFIGIEDVIHIDAGGSKRTPELVIAQGKQQIEDVLFAKSKAEVV